MKQLQLFATSSDSSSSNTKAETHWKLFIDGASRNNPGKAGAGIYILKDGKDLLRQGFFLGTRTNNEAEYYALLLGLFYVKKLFKKGDVLRVVSDSLLVVKQIDGAYKVRKPQLQPLHALGKKWVKQCNGHMQHVLRTENVEADRMANQGINKKLPVPQEFIHAAEQHGITW